MAERNSLINDFVEIDEKDTPYYHYLQSKGKANSIFDSFGPTNSKFQPYKEDPPLPSIQKTEPEKISKPSKNSIFEMDHRISKPALKMNSQELQALKEGVALEKDIGNQSPIAEKSGMSIPVCLPLQERSSSSKDLTLTEIPAFLMMNTSVEKQLDNSVLPAHGNINLNYLPISKNFLGEGLYSRVYVGHYTLPDSDIEYPCAVKKMRSNDESQRNGLYESFLLSRIHNQFILRLIDTVVDNDRNDVNIEKCVRDLFLYGTEAALPSKLGTVLVLEYCNSGDLWSWILKHPSQLGKKLYQKWLLELVSGIEAIHTLGIVHHDIKPHNILLTGLLDVRICDFGNALVVPEARENFVEGNLNYKVCPGAEKFPGSQVLRDGDGRGTLAYTASELLSTNQQYSFPVDIYSLGVVLYTILSMKEPFSNFSSSVQILLAAKKGFFANENQSLIEGWKNPDPSDGAWQYPNGEFVPSELVSIILNLVHTDPLKRPTISQICQKVRSLAGFPPSDPYQ